MKQHVSRLSNHSHSRLITVAYCGCTLSLQWYLGHSKQDILSDRLDRSLAVSQACGPCDQTKQALSNTHIHRILLLDQSSTTAYRGLQAIRHTHATLQKGAREVTLGQPVLLPW
ncbi:hypothetical protein ATANTOWER_007491 [Ataeniobius toweri]|uniref:Uncharacterized protein n=1 Tax=Ataeniobius toweri TaxID=208326 RepID=A0ABU7AN47_9TELE|nr:hypothetical protein [Ataeniobius toweri]